MLLPGQWSFLLMILVLAVMLRVACSSVFQRGRRRLPAIASEKKPKPFEADPSLSAHALLAGYWAHGGDHPEPCPAAETAVRNLERRYNLVLPEDFRVYLLNVAPKEDHWDDDDAIWWKLSRIRNIPEEYTQSLENPLIAGKARRYLFFADYCLWFWAWAICCEAGEDYGKVAVIGAGDRWVADSFTDFVRAYVTDPDSVN